MLKDKDDKLKHKYNIITRRKKRNSTQTATSEKIDVLFEIDDTIDNKDDYEYHPNSTYKKKVFVFLLYWDCCQLSFM